MLLFVVVFMHCFALIDIVVVFRPCPCVVSVVVFMHCLALIVVVVVFRHCFAELSPVCAIVGGVLGQEIIKVRHSTKA